MMKSLYTLLAISILSAVSTMSFADEDHDRAKRLVDTGDILPLEIILQKAQKIQTGKILEVDLENKKGNKIYEIELLTSDGSIIELKFNARTGEHLSTEKED